MLVIPLLIALVAAMVYLAGRGRRAGGPIDVVTDRRSKVGDVLVGAAAALTAIGTTYFTMTRVIEPDDGLEAMMVFPLCAVTAFALSLWRLYQRADRVEGALWITLGGALLWSLLPIVLGTDRLNPFMLMVSTAMLGGSFVLAGALTGTLACAIADRIRSASD